MLILCISVVYTMFEMRDITKHIDKYGSESQTNKSLHPFEEYNLENESDVQGDVVLNRVKNKLPCVT